MSFEGTFINGTVVLDEPPAMPEGARVDVVVKAPAQETKPTLLGLLKLAGTAQDLPADFAEEHDHYIHGTPRRDAKPEPTLAFLLKYSGRIKDMPADFAVEHDHYIRGPLQ